MVNGETNVGRLLVLTGASGVGKTTVANAITATCGDGQDVVVLHFDSIGVPTEADMEKKHGSGAGWQEAMTFEWANRLSKIAREESRVVFEGQMNIEFVIRAFDEARFPCLQICLIDCEEGEMERRLVEERGQPELVTQEMRNWRALLHQQAKDRDLPIIDTSKVGIGEAASILLERIGVGASD